MNIKSLYISAQEKGAGTLFVSMGMMEILKRNLHRVAFFRPIISSRKVVDGDIDFILELYNIDMQYEDAYGFDIEYVETMIASNRSNELINQLITKFKKLEDEYDFVLCEGIRRSFLTKAISYDLNIKIAQNFGSAVINIISARNATATEVYEDVLMESENLSFSGCTHFATFVNRLEDDKYDELRKKLQDKSQNIYLFKEIKELNLLTVKDVMDGVESEAVFIGESDHNRVIKGVKVAALTLNNFLYYIEEGDLIIVPADRSDIILGLLGALYSKNYPNISAIVFPFNMKAHKNIQKLVKGLDSFNIPVLSVGSDTYETAKNISNINARLRVDSERKIALALGLFHSNVDIELIERKIATAKSSVLTPMMFEYKLFERARLNKKRIILPESSDERILRAAEIILRRDVADIILIGKEDEIKVNYMRLGLDLKGVTILEHSSSELMDEFVEVFFKLRESKGLSRDAARDAMLHVNYFATMMVHLGYADGMVSGAVHSTGETIRPALQIIKTKPDISIVSSVFFMCLKTEVL
ncbi:MAG: phosphate acetyltransferase, partial [Epsilonproteobacteria bacterium]